MSKPLPSHLIVRAQTLSHVSHGFFTRQGGVSAAPFETLNASETVGDRLEDVAKNRARVAATLQVANDSLVTVTQVHSAAVITVTDASHAPSDVLRPKADAIVSTLSTHAVGILTADCGPVLLADATGHVVAAAHAGWRGAVQGVLENTVAAMRSLGAQEIRAVVGPCIGARFYEVADDMRSEVLEKDPYANLFFQDSKIAGRYQFDLAAYCVHRLRRAGLRHISKIRLDTLSDPQRFFSHRRMTLAGSAQTGRQISAIKAVKSA